jgi:prepilin-type N-terminal cleavage/methylation domain-containing protein
MMQALLQERNSMKDERGFTLIEVVITIAVFSIIALAFVYAFSTGQRILSITDERQTAISLAKSQMEYVKKLDYASSYTPAPIPPEYAGFKVVNPITGESITGRDENIQKIVVIVKYHDKEVIRLEDYKHQ